MLTFCCIGLSISGKGGEKNNILYKKVKDAIEIYTIYCLASNTSQKAEDPAENGTCTRAPVKKTCHFSINVTATCHPEIMTSQDNPQTFPKETIFFLYHRAKGSVRLTDKRLLSKLNDLVQKHKPLILIRLMCPSGKCILPPGKR